VKRKAIGKDASALLKESQDYLMTELRTLAQYKGIKLGGVTVESVASPVAFTVKTSKITTAKACKSLAITSKSLLCQKQAPPTFAPTATPTRPPEPFKILFIGTATITIGTNRVKGMIAGSYKTNTGANAKGHFLGVQVFADGTVFNTRGLLLASLIHDSGNFLGAKTGPMKGVTFGAAISFPNGVKLSNLPLIGKIPNIKYVPPLGKGLIFTYSNKRNGVNKLMDNLPVSCAKKGGILDKKLGSIGC
jgi:hypothetical protein